MMTPLKGFALLTSWLVLVALVIFSARNHDTHITQPAPAPKYEITHGGAVLPSITMPERASRDTLAEQGSVDIDANGLAAKPSPTKKVVKHGPTKRNPKVVSISTHEKHKAKPPHKKRDRAHHTSGSGGVSSGGHGAHSPSSGGSHGGADGSPLGSTWPAPPFSPAFGAFG